MNSELVTLGLNSGPSIVAVLFRIVFGGESEWWISEGITPHPKGVAAEVLAFERSGGFQPTTTTMLRSGSVAGSHRYETTGQVDTNPSNASDAAPQNGRN